MNITAVVQDSTRIVRAEPGQTDLENATPIQLTDLQLGERILVVGDVLDDAGSISASTIVAIKYSETESK